jgi:hypothetical protein
MIYQLFYYSYYLNYGLYFIGSYYVIGTINLTHDIYNKYTKNNDSEIIVVLSNLDPKLNDWTIID